ncbi:acyltransferase family protein [Terribacillus sp. DMT04]|uniref:acyltransferase family protein n=1 Tax=Terribacillus sp. DMT04 TaxID=2850441 RepID=UPI001C2C4D91|nr:acyltransferase family protein [Terribacillus sp. DMT04]QXE01081.1 acyltransferase family protein [Terribacillus sp. DMT04]
MNREKWIDIAKGLSILLVVIGHWGHLEINHFLAWFRMPFFFFVSGLIFKYVAKERYLLWSKKQVLQLMVPYLSYGILFIFIFYPFNPTSAYLIDTTYNFLYGGMVLKGAHTIFWFITCLLLTRLLFGFLLRYALSIQFIIIGSGYLLSHLLAVYYPNFSFPWNADVAFVTLGYFACGYYMKSIITKWITSKRIIVTCLFIWFAFMGLDVSGILRYTLDLKYRIYEHMLLDLLVPISIVLVVLSVCYFLAKTTLFDWITKLGESTATIMYLHVPLNMLVVLLIDYQYEFILYTVIGISIPLILGYLLHSSSILSFLFLGRIPVRHQNRKDNQHIS